MATMNKKMKKLMWSIMKKITRGRSSDKFQLINAEAGSRKTYALILAMVYLYKTNPKIKSLIVSKYDEANEDTDCMSISEAINKMAGAKIAVAINSTNVDEMVGISDEFPVVIITHARYKLMCKDSYQEQRKKITKGRYNLIVDEEVDIVAPFVYSLARRTIVKSILGEINKELEEKYLELTEDISAWLKVDGNKIIKLESEFSFIKRVQIDELRTLIKQYVKKDYVKQYRKNDFNELLTTRGQASVEDVLEHLDCLGNLYFNVAYKSGNVLYTYDEKQKYWLLENNVLLDANGGLNKLYSLSKLFNCTNEKKIFNHKKWTVFVSQKNTTQTAINGYDNYIDEVTRLLYNNVKETDNALVVCHVKQEKVLNKKKLSDNIKLEHYNNINGKNTWRYYNKVFIPQTFNLDEHLYVLKCLYYSENNIDITTERGGNPGGMRKFNNKELNEVRISLIAGEIYQAIKRIDRSVSQSSEVYLICADEEVVSLVTKQLTNCKVKELEVNFKKTYKPRRKRGRKEKVEGGKGNMLINVLKTLEPGEYPKNIIREMVGIPNKTGLSPILKDEMVGDFMRKNNIYINNNSIVKSIVPFL